MKTVLLIAIFLLTGCGTLQPIAESPTTFAVCEVADVATTAYALNSGHFHEANPLLKGLIGPHNFVPLITISIVAYLIIRHFNEPKITMAANAVKCGVAVRNALVIW